MERRHPFVDQIKRRPHLVIFELTLENRNNLLGTITARIREELQQNR
jgi:nucleoside-triphosphatase THEP1